MSTDKIDKLYKNYEILSEAKDKSEVSFIRIFSSSCFFFMLLRYRLGISFTKKKKSLLAPSSFFSFDGFN